MSTHGIGAIVLAFLFICVVDAERVAAQPQFEKWGIAPGSDGASMVAGTVNDSGQILAQGCWFGSGDCLWMIGLDVSCVKGEKGQVLVNPDGGGGTVMLEIYCLEGTPTSGKRYRFAFTDFEKIDRLVRSNSMIGFAMALRSGLFQVVRFELAGAPQAIEAMRTVARDRGAPTLRNTRDRRL